MKEISEMYGSHMQLLEGMMKRDYQINDMRKDIDKAHTKIRENEQSYIQTTKAQNKALLAILLWLKDPDHRDMKQIDDAINAISL